MWTRALGVLLALGATAHAKSFAIPSAPDQRPAPAVLELGALGTAFRFEALKVAVTSHEVDVTAHLTMTVSATEPFGRLPGEMQLGAVIPMGAHVIGTALSRG